MFSSQDVDYSLNRPCRALSAVAPQSSKSSTKATSSADSGGWDDDEDYLGPSTSSFTSHRFLVGSAIPSVSKLSDNNNDVGDGNNTNTSIIDEDDEERTNRLYLLIHEDDEERTTQESTWVHPTGEIWSIGCHPTRGDWVVTCGGGSVFSPSTMMGNDDEEKKSENVPLTKFHTTLWRLPELSDGGDEDDFDESDTGAMISSSSKLEPVVTIPHGGGGNYSASNGWEQRVGQILWNPLLSPAQSSGDALYDLADTSSKEGGGNLLTVGWDNQSPLSLWDISSLSDVKEVWSTTCGSGVASSRSQRNNRFGRFASMNSALPRRVSWDPHDTHRILSTAGEDVEAYDMRSPASNGGMGVIRSAHRYGVADICHSHLQSNVVVTSGMDGVMKFWDLRKHVDPFASSNIDNNSSSLPPPLLKAVRGGHSHWTTRASYNPFYDQLVLSGGSDGIVNLWRISSCSSAPLLELDDEEDDDEGIGEERSFEADGTEDENAEEAASGGKEYMNEQEGWMDDMQPTTPKSDDEDEYDKGDKTKSPRTESNAHDIRVTRFECSDVTADLAWSATDPWVYATLSCDGAIAVHHVPSKEKYKILL